MRKRNERRLEILIEEALKEDVRDSEKNFLENGNIAFSKNHENNMKKLLNQQRIKYLWVDNKNIIRKVAVILIICFVGINVLAFSVEAIRVKFFNYSIEQNEKYTEINYNTTNKYISDDIKLLYIPQNFVVKKEVVSDVNIYLKFEYEKNYFCLSIEKIEGTTQIDTEQAIIKNQRIKEWDVMIIQKENENIAYWNDNSYAYSLYGNITEKDLINIINNLKKNTTI